MPSAFWTRYHFAAAPGRSCKRPAPLAGGQSRPPLRGKWESILRRAGPMCPAAVAFIFRPGRTQRSRASTGPRGTSGCRGKYPWGAPTRLTVTFPRPTPVTSAQAAYPSARRKRHASLTPLCLLSPLHPLTLGCGGDPICSHRLGMTATSAQPPPSFRGSGRRGNPSPPQPSPVIARPVRTLASAIRTPRLPRILRIPTSPVCALVPRNDSYFCPTAPVIARSAATRQSVSPLTSPIIARPQRGRGNPSPPYPPTRAKSAGRSRVRRFRIPLTRRSRRPYPPISSSRPSSPCSL